MDGVSGDLQAKYQKVASEYSKVRAQVSVLKKAVLDEQTKNSELRDILKEREQSLRKAEQEMDSLTFRNQQLTRRVTVLQDELDSVSKSKKGKSKVPDTINDSNNQIMGEEFHKTITENAKLLSLMQDKEESHRQDMEHLAQRIEQLEHELRSQQDQHKRAVSKLEKEKAAALSTAIISSPTGIQVPSGSSRVDQRVEALQKSNTELTAHARELSAQREQLTSQLEDATRIIRTRLPFIDSNDRDLNELNIPHHDRGHQAHVLRTVKMAGNHVEELAGALEAFHSHIQNRLLIIHSSLSPLNTKFAEHLQDSGRQLHLLKQGFINFQQGLENESWTLDTAPSLTLFSRPLRSYSLYLQKLQPYYQLSVEEECILIGASDQLLSSSREVVSCSAYFSVQITKISGYVQLLAGQNRRHSQHPVQSQERFLKEVTQSLRLLHQALLDLLGAFTVKSTLEEKIMDANTREETEGLLNSLSLAVSSSEKLVYVMNGYHSETTADSELGKQAHPTVSMFHQRASNYLASLEQKEPPSVPYTEALSMKGEVKCKAESFEALLSQLKAIQDLLAQTERDREHWQQEYHLLQLRSESNDSSSKTGNLSRPSSNTIGGAVESKDGESGKAVLTNLLGKFSVPMMPPPEVEAREEKLKEYFRSRLHQLMARCQTSESKAITFMSECAVFKSRLEDAEQSKKLCEEQALKLSEELATTTQGYDTQLAVMSEHLANMNEKLALQRDTIDDLKFHSKTSKRGKQK